MSQLDPQQLDRPVEIIRGGSDGAFWEILRCPPAEVLQPFILGPYYGWTEQIAGQVQRRELPRVMVPVIFNFGTPFAIASANPDSADGLYPPASHTSFAAGLHDRYVVTTSHGRSECLQVNFTLLGAYRLGLDLAGISRQVVAAADVFGPGASRLCAQLQDVADWQRRFALLEAFILQRFARDITPAADIRGALALMHQNHGLSRISHLARRLDISQKRLIHRFQDEIGMTPKSIAQLLRFHHALNLLRQDVSPPLSQLAAECGYYDQAHFNRDFKLYCGFTPTELLARRDPTIESVPH